MALIDQLIGEIDGRIARLLPEASPAEALFGMMRYHLGWVDERFHSIAGDPGKRIRSRLCLLACQAAGAVPERALAAATAVELVHNFSLIHDDLQDRSDTRRHRRTVWVLWGDAQAINAGDGMLALAQLALAEDRAAEAETVVRAFRALNTACRRLCEGQFLDMDYEGRPSVNLDEYYTMIERKTAALIEAACFLGALFAGAGREVLDAHSSFGRHLGLAFQVQDDYLGVWGDPGETGKPAADDVASKKKALPLVYTLATAGDAHRGRLSAILARRGPAEPDEVAEILDIMDRCGAAEFAASESARLSRAALDALGAAQAEPHAREELAELCRRLTIRRR